MTWPFFRYLIIKGIYLYFYRYNISIIYYFQLEKRVQFHEHLRPVCLPTANTQLIPGTLCTVIGWGKKNDTDSTYLKILRSIVIILTRSICTASEYELAVNEVQVPVLNRKVCNFWIAYKEMNVTEGMICAGYPDGGKDACQVKTRLSKFFQYLNFSQFIEILSSSIKMFNRAILEVRCCARTNKTRRNGLSVE